MTESSRAISSIGFIHLATFDRAHPRAGLEGAIEVFKSAEALGFNTGSLYTRHLQYGLSSPAVLLGAISQHTERIGLGTTVIPLSFENPRSLAEDLATADILSGGRLRPAFSVQPPRYSDEVNDLVFGQGWRDEDFSYGRLERLRGLLAGEKIREIPPFAGVGGDFDSDRVEPHSPGLADRLWYGGGSLASAEWAGRSGLSWVASGISSSENGVTDVFESQRNQIDAFRAAHPLGEAARTAVARVLIPTDGADAASLARYRQHVEGRTPRTKKVHEAPGGKKMIIAQDQLGSVDELVEQLRADVALQASDELLLSLPFEFEPADWQYLLEVFAGEIAPALGWRP